MNFFQTELTPNSGCTAKLVLCNILVLFLLPYLPSVAVANEYVAKTKVSDTLYFQQEHATAKTAKDGVQSVPERESYSLAPLLQDAQYYYYLSDANSETTHTFTQDWKTIGNNDYGTVGGKVLLIEKSEKLENGNYRTSVQVTTVNANNDAEPWVDESHSGEGFTTWRLDIGSDAGGSNKINPEGDFEIVASGVWLFGSDGEFQTEIEIEDTSDSNGLSGLAIVGFEDNSDIAGHDMATMIMFWDYKIESETPDTGYKVTSGQTGAWYDPTHDGEGYILQVMSDTEAVVFWFTYDETGKQFWMLGVGQISGSKITFDELQSTHGGKFGPDFDPEDVVYVDWGTLELNFSDCNNAVATYDGPQGFGSGSLDIQRITSAWGLDCNGKGSSPPSTGTGFLSSGFSGAWFDVSHNGEGFTVEVLDETTALVYWFTYDTEGNQAWMVAVAQINGASIFASEVLQPKGAKFGSGFDPGDVQYNDWGEAVFSFGSCDPSFGGSMRYFPPPEFGVESTQLLAHLVSIGGTECSFLTGTHDVSGSITVAENIYIDGDVNDPNIEEIPNDPGDGLPEQQLVSPARVAGFITAVPTGVSGDRFEKENDEYDTFLLPLREGEGLTLTISDWDSGDEEAVDFDLYLSDVNDPENFAASSLTTNKQETVFAPFDGNFFVFVHAYKGTSNYLLQSGQSGQISANQIDSTADFVPNQIMASLRGSSLPESGEKAKNRALQIQALESNYQLERIGQNADGEVLYQVAKPNIITLQPHPLSILGFGSITPEQWHLIKLSKSLASSDNYRWAAPNYVYNTFNRPNDPGYPYQWHYEQIRLPDAWETTTGSSQVVVAVLDTGVWRHHDLIGNVDFSLGYDFVSSWFFAGDGDGIDSNAEDPGEDFPLFQDYISHGTHVAGTVGAMSDDDSGVAGVNWNVTIMPVRVLGTQGGTCHDINQGLRWAGRLANDSGRLPAIQADVINLSLGGKAPCAGSQDIINQLVGKGIVVIAAAGNDGNTIPNYPASLNNVFSVSATTIADTRAYYSSYGWNVDVAAPGGDITSDLNFDSYADGILSPAMVVEQWETTRQESYLFLQGTSMASPHVAGVAGLMKSVFPDMESRHFSTAISSGGITTDLAQNGDTEKDIEYGYGRIDAQKAVQWALKAEQGEETDAFLTSSSSALDFSWELESIHMELSKAGEGNLSITDIGWTEAWMTLSALDVDQDGLGEYRISVDRDTLSEGQYSGWIAIDSSDGKRMWISVFMRVGESVAGQAEYIYALMLSQWTFQNVKTWEGPQQSNGFDHLFENLPPESYYLLVGTDLDHDYTICDEGELCEYYPSNSVPSPIKITDRDLELGVFRLTFPTPSLGSVNEESDQVQNSMSTGSKQSKISLPLGVRRPRVVH